MEDVFLPIVICGMLFVGMPWIILHYITRWKQAPKITQEDENLLDDLYVTARRLEERLMTIERIVAADHPDFRLGQPSAHETTELPNYDFTRRN